MGASAGVGDRAVEPQMGGRSERDGEGGGGLGHLEGTMGRQ